MNSGDRYSASCKKENIKVAIHKNTQIDGDSQTNCDKEKHNIKN